MNMILRTNNLTAREFEVLQLIANEMTTNEIADRLYISADTAKTHRKNLLVKMNARNVAGLIVRSYRAGIMSV